MWNKLGRSEIPDDSDDVDKTNATPPLAQPQHNQSELEEIFVRVGLQDKIASKVADEVFEKLGRRSDQKITFDDFVSLIHSDATNVQMMAAVPGHCHRSTVNDDRGDIRRNIIDELPTISNIDLHAHSGLFNNIHFSLFVFVLFQLSI